MKIETPITTDSYLADFSEMIIKTVNIESITTIFDGDEMDLDEYIYNVEAPSLVAIKTLLDKKEFDEAYKQIAEQPHYHLWKLLAEKALLDLNYENAEKAFVEYDHYAGIIFCQRLQMMENRVLQKAEVYTFFSRFQEAEELLVRSERKDLAIQLMTKIGDYENVMGLIMEGAGSDTL